MGDKIIVTIKGIICDNPDCAFRDDEIPFEEYGPFINKPCPSCGEILLTEEDYEQCVNIHELVKFTNSLDDIKSKDGSEVATVKFQAYQKGDGKHGVKLIVDGEEFSI